MERGWSSVFFFSSLLIPVLWEEVHTHTGLTEWLLLEPLPSSVPFPLLLQSRANPQAGHGEEIGTVQSLALAELQSSVMEGG